MLLSCELLSRTEVAMDAPAAPPASTAAAGGTSYPTRDEQELSQRPLPKDNPVQEDSMPLSKPLGGLPKGKISLFAVSI